jgi:hypothetical protein
MADTYDAKATDFVPDPHNANAGTERGQYLLDESVQRNGLGRSIVVSRDGVVIAGNKTLQAAIDAGLVRARVVETDGHELVVVKRSDIESGTAKFVNMALADNRASEVGLSWDVEALEWGDDIGADLEAWWYDWELEQLKIPPDNEEEYAIEWEGMPEFEQEDLTSYQSIRVHFATVEDRNTFAALIDQRLTDNTKSIWYPEAKERHFMDKRYANES